ncbi:hypothetical protein Ancab_010897 [Ancistrocladus abbreviatus]
MFKQLDSDDNRGKEERRGTDELTGLDSDESIFVGWVSEMKEGVQESLVIERIPTRDGITDTGLVVEHFQNIMVTGGDMWNTEEEEGVRDACEEVQTRVCSSRTEDTATQKGWKELYGQNKETLPMGLNDDKLSSTSIRPSIWPKLPKKAQSIVIRLSNGTPSNRKLNPANLGQKSRSKPRGHMTHSSLPNQSGQPIDGEKVEKRKVKRSKCSSVVSIKR